MTASRPTSDSSTFRFVRSPTGEILRRFQTHEHDRNWTPVSDYEAAAYFESIGADLEALDLAYVSAAGPQSGAEAPAAPDEPLRPPRRGRKSVAPPVPPAEGFEAPGEDLAALFEDP